MSGYTDDTIIRHGVLAPDLAPLQKPFTQKALMQRVRAVLEEVRSGTHSLCRRREKRTIDVRDKKSKSKIPIEQWDA